MMREKLKTYAGQLGFVDLEERLDKIALSMTDDKAPLILPLVGEFSAGKTTLINALSDSKALQCASEPTTATIYALHFGASANHAIIHYQDGTVSETDNISELDNKALTDAVVIDVYDTSSKVPASVMLVDTPGLSSHDVKHRQNLVEFLPQADGVLLTVDVNQPITKSLTEFARTIELSHRPLYMILTHCDTKSEKDVEEQKQYIQNNTELNLSGIACVSAKNGNLAEFDNLLSDIQKDKTRILNKVNDFRMKEIAKEMIERIDTLLSADESNEALENEMREQQLKLNKLRRELDNMTQDIEADIEAEGRNISRRFEDKVFTRLETIVTGSSQNFDGEAVSAINNTASMMLNDFRSQVSRIFGKHAAKCAGISSIDLSNFEIMDMRGCYNISLNEAGHEYDSKIGSALKVAAAVGLVAVAGGVAGAAARGATAAGETAAASGAAVAGSSLGTAGSVMVAVDVADTVTDVASIIHNKRNADRIGKIIKYGNEVSDKLNEVNRYDETAGQRMGSNKGIVASMVGFVTERTMGRPQRKRVISQYIDSTLTPVFKSEISRVSQEMIKTASDTILSDSQASVDAMTSSLETLKNTRESQKAEYESKIKELQTIKKELQTLWEF